MLLRRISYLLIICLSLQSFYTWYGIKPKSFVRDTLLAIPYIGNYHSEQYEWRMPLFGATLETAQLLTAPPAVLQALKELLQLPANISNAGMLQQLEERGTRHWYQIVWGEPLFGQTSDHTYNVVLHPVVADWRNAKEGQWFEENIEVGLFAPEHIQQSPRTPLLLNQWQTVNVNYHAPEDFSPDNARIYVDDNAPRCSFWLIAVRKKAQGTLTSPISISHHIILHNHSQEEQELQTIMQCTL